MLRRLIRGEAPRRASRQLIDEHRELAAMYQTHAMAAFKCRLRTFGPAAKKLASWRSIA